MLAHMSLPPESSQSVYSLNGVRTELIILKFTNTIIVSLNQLQKIGTILLAKHPLRLQIEDSDVTPTITTLLGKDDTPTHLYARALIEHIPPEFSLVLFLGLKSHIPKEIPLVVRMVNECKIW